MQRVGLAVLIIAAVAAILAVFAPAARRRGPGGSGDLPALPEGAPTRKLAFVLLAALVLYVSLGGAD